MQIIFNRQTLIDSLIKYVTVYPEEINYRDQFLTLLEHPRCFHRDHLPGHLTGSAWIVDQSRQSVLLTHHTKLNKWLQPGGHADGDEDIVAVALREAEEETGIKQFTLPQEAIFDIDIHTIPARKDFPEHLHFDIRFLLQADVHESLFITDESNDLKWFLLNDLEKLTKNHSMLRMQLKVLKNSND